MLLFFTALQRAPYKLRDNRTTSAKHHNTAFSLLRRSSRGIRKLVSDMDDHSKMKGEIRDIVKWALDNMTAKQDRELSAHIKRKCDALYGPTWQCIVGEDFKAAFTCVLRAGTAHL